MLRELIGRPDAPLGDDAKAHILGQLDRAEQRFALMVPPGERSAS